MKGETDGMKSVQQMPSSVRKSETKHREADAVWVTRDALPVAAKGLSPSLRFDLQVLRDELNKLVPEDFGYRVELGDEEPRLG